MRFILPVLLILAGCGKSEGELKSVKAAQIVSCNEITRVLTDLTKLEVEGLGSAKVPYLSVDSQCNYSVRLLIDPPDKLANQAICVVSGTLYRTSQDAMFMPSLANCISDSSYSESVSDLILAGLEDLLSANNVVCEGFLDSDERCYVGNLFQQAGLSISQSDPSATQYYTAKTLVVTNNTSNVIRGYDIVFQIPDNTLNFTCWSSKGQVFKLTGKTYTISFAENDLNNQYNLNPEIPANSSVVITCGMDLVNKGGNYHYSPDELEFRNLIVY